MYIKEFSIVALYFVVSDVVRRMSSIGRVQHVSRLLLGQLDAELSKLSEGSFKTPNTELFE